MECPSCFSTVYNTDGYKIRTKWCFISKRKKINCVKTMYAGFILSLVPLALCETDGSSHLTYASIFNNTNYPQIQYSARPYRLQLHTSHNVNTHHNKLTTHDLTQENDVEFEEYDYEDAASNNDQLLVGFARDPFRYSIPHEDYRKGVRTINADSDDGNRNENRGKRGVLHLYNMLYCATGCEPLSYKGYGCYCGFLGSGRPTDGIDRCCKMHDECYENIYCPVFTVYFQPYYWKCYRGEPLCALENYQTQNHLVNGCAARLCECDRRLAMCIRRYNCPRKRALCRSSPLRLLQNLLMIP